MNQAAKQGVGRRTVLRRLGIATASATPLGGVAAACGGAAEPPVSSRGPTMLRVLTRSSQTNVQEDAWKFFNEHQSQGQQVKVEAEKGPEPITDYGRKLLALAAADSAPDLMYTHPNFFASLASTKLLVDVEKIAARAKFDLKGVQKDLLDSDRWDGVLYSLPYSGVAYIIVYNIAQFQKRGVALPPEQIKAGNWTWDGFRTTLQRLTLRAPGQLPEAGMPRYESGLQYQSQWVFGNGGQVWSKDLKRCVMDMKESVAALDLLAQMHFKDRSTIQVEEAEQFGGSSLEGFPTGRVGLRFRATTEITFYKQMAEEGAKLGVAPVPKGPVSSSPRGAANSWGISSTSKAPDAAWQAIAAWHADPLLGWLFSNRLSFPCRESQFQHPTFKSSLLPWEDLEVERAALREARVLYSPAKITEIDAIWQKLWPDARDGKKLTKDVIADFVPQANALL